MSARRLRDDRRSVERRRSVVTIAPVKQVRGTITTMLVVSPLAFLGSFMAAYSSAVVDPDVNGPERLDYVKWSTVWVWSALTTSLAGLLAWVVLGLISTKRLVGEDTWGE